MTASKETLVRCRCGNVEYGVRGQPIMVAACHCDDCQAGGRQLEALTNAFGVLDAAGGTEYLLYRKDRVHCLKGEALLVEYRLKPDAGTKRVVAACCNSPMLLDFEKGHWYSVYRDRLVGAAPPLQMRIQTRFKPANAQLPDNVRAYDTWPLRFIAKLLAARVAMLVSR